MTFGSAGFGAGEVNRTPARHWRARTTIEGETAPLW